MAYSPDQNLATDQTQVQTTDASATTIDTFFVNPGSTVRIFALIGAHRTGGAAGTADDSAGIRIEGTFKDSAGSAVQVGSTDISVDTDQGTWTAAFSISGSLVSIQVTGAVNNNITWTCSSQVITCRTK